MGDVGHGPKRILQPLSEPLRGIPPTSSRLHGLRNVTPEADPDALAWTVPRWYRRGVAMNLRLDEHDAALLQSLARAQDISMHEAVLRAIRRAAWEVEHTGRVREATAEMQARWGDVLQRLGEA